MLNFFKKRKIKSAIVKKRRDREFFNYDLIRNVLIIFNIEDWKEIHHVISSLEDDGKTVKAWTVRPKDKPMPQRSPYNLRIIDYGKDISWSQSLSDAVIEEFQRLDYDTFIDFSSAENSTLEYLLAINTSKFCIGFRQNELNLYDFVLLKNEETSIYKSFEQMKNYLQNIG